MHHLYYVAVDKNNNTAEEARKIAQQVLDNNNFSSDEGGFWNANKADWYVIGGRWSGHLTEIKLDNFHKKALALCKLDFITEDVIKKNNTALQALWDSLGGKLTHRWSRNSYNQIGEADDSMLLDTELYKAMQKDTTPETEIAVLDGYESIEDEMLVKDFLKDKKVIGKYYIVVVDYHN